MLTWWHLQISSMQAVREYFEGRVCQSWAGNTEVVKWNWLLKNHFRQAAGCFPKATLPTPSPGYTFSFLSTAWLTPPKMVVVWQHISGFCPVFFRTSRVPCVLLQLQQVCQVLLRWLTAALPLLLGIQCPDTHCHRLQTSLWSFCPKCPKPCV